MVAAPAPLMTSVLLPSNVMFPSLADVKVYVPAAIWIVCPVEAAVTASVRFSMGELIDPSLLALPPLAATATYHPGPRYSGVAVAWLEYSPDWLLVLIAFTLK